MSGDRGLRQMGRTGSELLAVTVERSWAGVTLHRSIAMCNLNSAEPPGPGIRTWGSYAPVWLWLDERNRGGDLNVDQQLSPTLHLLVQSSLPGRQHGAKLLEVGLAPGRDPGVDLQEALCPIDSLGVRHSVVVLRVLLDERVFVVVDHDEFLDELVIEGPEPLRLGVGEGHVRGDDLF